MKDFQLRNDTKLLFRDDPKEALIQLFSKKRVLFIYGGGSVKKNGCYDDIKESVEKADGIFYELNNASRELTSIEMGIDIVKKNDIELIIGAGGANIMDCAKLVSFGAYHEDELWDYVKGKKNPYGLSKVPLILMPTYPSSGSEYGMGAVSSDSRTGDFGTAYGITADVAVLTPKYSMSLDSVMTSYTGLVTLVQLSASTIGDKNPVSYDIGISVIRNVLDSTKTLKKDPTNVDARGVILYGASISTSSRLGLGKEDNYIYDLYELEFIPEVLYKASYRQSLTTIFPRFLKVMSKYHEDDIKKYFKDAFGYDGSIEESTKKLIELFESLGIDMYFDGKVEIDDIKEIDITTSLSLQEVKEIISECLK